MAWTNIEVASYLPGGFTEKAEQQNLQSRRDLWHRPLMTGQRKNTSAVCEHGCVDGSDGEDEGEVWASCF